MSVFLLDGYQTVRPLTGTEAAALPLVLPVAHVEYALSEMDYFASVAVSADAADLAYEYLIGHAWWFGQPPGAALLGFLAGHLRRASVRLADAAAVVAFLAGPGSGWISGQNLAADGGRLP